MEEDEGMATPRRIKIILLSKNTTGMREAECLRGVEEGAHRQIKDHRQVMDLKADMDPHQVQDEDIQMVGQGEEEDRLIWRELLPRTQDVSCIYLGYGYC